MHQILKKTLIVAGLVIGLAGCHTNNETALQDKRTDRTLPIGYYSNENHEKSGNGGNAIILEGSDNDGPAVEIMDHTMGKESETNKRVMRSNNSASAPNPSAPLIDAKNARFGDPSLGGSDINYHGHLNNANSTQRKSYYNGYDGKLAEEVTTAAKSVENVKDARTIIYENNVIIGLQSRNGNLDEATKRNVHQAIRHHVADRNIYYVTNESRFNALKIMDNDLKNGGNREQINTEIKNLIRSINNNHRQ